MHIDLWKIREKSWSASRDEDRRRKAFILQGIVPVIEAAAERGEYFAAIMVLRHPKDGPEIHQNDDGSDLEGVAAEVFTYCVAMELDPWVSPIHDAHVSARYSIVVHW